MSKDFHLQAKGEREDVCQCDTAVGHCRHDVEVAGAQFVIGRDAFVETAVAPRYIVFDALSNEKVITQFGVETIISLGVFRWFVAPEAFAEDGVGEAAAGERFEFPSLATHRQRDIPGDVALLDGEGVMVLTAVAIRKIAEEDFRFELITAPVMPTSADGEHADGACKLQRVLVGGETRPVTLQALRSAGIERSGLRVGGFNGVGLYLQGVKRRQQLGGINGVALLANSG